MIFIIHSSILRRMLNALTVSCPASDTPYCPAGSWEAELHIAIYWGLLVGLWFPHSSLWTPTHITLLIHSAGLWRVSHGTMCLLTFLLMCSNMCSCPCRKYKCWNSVSSRSGFTRPLCSMLTTLRKPSGPHAQYEKKSQKTKRGATGNTMYTYTCWAVEQSLPCYCAWSTWARLPWRSVPGQIHGNWFQSKMQNESRDIQEYSLCY